MIELQYYLLSHHNIVQYQIIQIFKLHNKLETSQRKHKSMDPQPQKLMQQIQDIYLHINQNFKIIISSDPSIVREDSARALLSQLNELKKILTTVNEMPIDKRTKYFNLQYNAIVYIADIGGLLRKSNFSFEVIKELIDCILAMESNIILQDAKYLQKRTKLYLDICHIYEQNQLLQPTLALLDIAITKYKQLKAIHELDPPIPAYIDTIITNNIRILRIMWIKYSVQVGTVGVNDWKKRVDEEFGDDMGVKLIALVETLRTETRRQANIFQKNPHSTMNKAYKQPLVQIGYDMIKPNLDIIQKSLNQQKSKIERQLTFKNTLQLTQQLINEQIKKKREAEDKYTKLNDFKKASANFPFQYHTELIHYAYQVKNLKVVASLLEVALLRIECRRIQMPYLSDVGIIASSTPNPNIPNGYQKIPIDLNQANLREQLKQLRKKNQGKGIQEQKPPQPPKQSKQSKKAPKDPKAPAQSSQQPKKNKDAPTEWQLKQLNHKYVYMIIKRTMSPENAIYDLNIVMGDEEEGPAGYMDSRRIVVPYIQEDMELRASQVKQYRGIREATKMVPYIVLKHSKSGLEDQQEKVNVLIDVKPLIAKNPIMPASWGYTKIPIDLRQVPQQFLKTSNHDYIYITYKTDSLFYSCQRHIKILNALNQLQSSPSSTKAENPQDQKLLELGINFSLQKLNNLFLVLQECLDGKLGQNYYVWRCDFLTQLAYHLWVKYLRGPLVQFDYVNQMKLNQELIDYDYNFYKEALLKSKPVFLNGFKVLNFIMINNQKSDILLLSRINLQLLKLLQQERQYKQAYQNAKMCLDRIRIYRDQYLTQGVKGNSNRLLPFSLTCSNIKIKQTLQKMQKKFRQQRNYIRKQKRILQRKGNSKQQLTQQQLQQQQNQYLHYQKKDQIDQIIQKVDNKHIQLISILAAVELDIYNIYFRTTLKHSQLLKVVERQSSNSVINGVKQASLVGLASTMKNKLSLMTGKYESKNQKNLKQLQTTLIQADKLPPPKPGLHWLEKKTIQQFQKNPYAMALLMGNFAAINSQSQDKKYYLQQSLQHIKNCIEQQKTQSQLAIKNAIFLFSTLWDDQIRPQNSSSSISPFKQLYDGTWPCAAPVPDQPIIISKNSSTITMKMPPFRHLAEGKKKKKVINMSLYGKPSANGVDVSVNCDQLQGTGLKNRIDQVVKVTNLKSNSIYCFAVAPTNQQFQLQPIGKTCTDIRTLNPLPIPMLAAYIAKISYQINQYQTAYNAAKIVIDQVCEQSGYVNMDQKLSGLYMYKFKESVLKSMSLMEIRSIAQTLYIMALCQRRKLSQSRQTTLPILTQSHQQRITNWLMLASLLNPCLTSPIVSIPFLIPQDHIIMKALSLSLIPPKWMNSKLRELGVKVMEKVLKWGLERNQIGLARRVVYRWAERKWMMLGKIIQIEEKDTKKDAKKGAKDTKQQQVKLIDKYCRMLVEKSPGQMELFEDSLAVMSQQYSDFTSIFIQKAKQQIQYYSQFVDNTPQQIDALTNKLNSKLQLTQYLKDPVPNIKKFPQTSPYYLQYNCKLLRKALQISLGTPQQLKALQAKAQQLSVPLTNKQIVLARQIQKLMLEAIQNNIEWVPSAKNQVIRLQEKTGKNLQKQIQIYSDYQTKMGDLTRSVGAMDSFLDKYVDFDYINIWLAQLYYLKATIAIMNSSTFNVKNPVKGRFDKIRLMNLQDLLKKKKQIQILDKQSISYSQQQIKNLSQILKLLSQSAYSSFCIQNWIKLQNVFKLIYNLMSKYLITPFYHLGHASIWQYLAFISLLGILMLKKIRSQGFDTFKTRYQTKQSRTQLRLISSKLSVQLQPYSTIPEFYPKYFMPELDPSTTKNFWFQNQTRIDLESIAAVVAYTVQMLRLEGKFNLVIGTVRDFCNVVQHWCSLEFLPFMIQSQQKLIDQVKESIDKQNATLNQVINQFTKKKTSKMKGQRQHKLTNQPLPYQIQYQQKRKKILQSIQLLTNHKNYLQAQIQASQTIIDQIKRDTSKTVLKQREQRKYMAEFGDDQQHMFKNYGQFSVLAKNRRNAVKEIIDQYEKIYKELKENKTSKDTLAEIQNRNQVGNLYFAAGENEKAGEFWQDALATIFKTVRPVDNYIKIFEQRKTFLVESIGEKQTILSLNLLYKISKYASFKKLYYQFNCTKMANRLATCLYENDAKHPKSLLSQATYRLTKLSEKDSLQDETTINLSELINSLSYFALRMIDMGNSIQALPILNIYEHIVTDIVKNAQSSVICKLIKSIALANSGLISESISYLAKVANEKDLPTIWIQPSDQMKREKGSNWYFQEVAFDNSKSWNDNANKQAIQFLKKLNVKNDFVNNYGLVSIPLFNYAKGLTLSKIFIQQIYDNFQTNQLRISNIQQSQIIMRDSLKKLAILQQHYSNLQDIQTAKLKLKKDEVNQQAQKAVQAAKTAMSSYLKANGIEEALVGRYQSEKPSSVKKVFRVEFMARIRFSLHQTYVARRLSSNSYFVLKNGLTNIHRISYGSRKVQTGYDPQIALVQPQQQPPPGKKDDKKGAKKEQQSAPVLNQAIDWQKQKQINQKAQQMQTRSSVNIFWHLKLMFQIGKLMYQQNSFKTCKAIFSQLLLQSKEYLQHYYSLFGQGYILRCQLRLGRFDPVSLSSLILLAKQKQYERQDYLDLVMDLGEIVKGDKSVELYTWGRDVAGKLWGEIGMGLRLGGIDVANPERMFSNKEEFTPEQQEQIKRKNKKAEKKPGKDDKKAAKKQDPKKKKQQTKIQYKVQPLSKHEWWNLLDEQKQSYENYVLKPHPNYHPNNVYSLLPLQYIKCYVRHLEASIEHRFEADLLAQVAYIRKLIKIVQGYPVNGYYSLLHLYFCIAQLNKCTFKHNLSQLLKSHPLKKPKSPQGILPLNSDLITLPQYSQFIFDNRAYLLQAEVNYKKLITLIKGSCLLFDNAFRLQEVLWKAAENQLWIVEYVGRGKPKFWPEAPEEGHVKLEAYNQLGEAINQIQLSIKIATCIDQLYNNYAQLGSKPLQPTAKLDSDITQQISQVDKQFKQSYPKLLSDSLKPKQGTSSLQLITYLLKLHRQSEFMTYSNSYLQNVIFRCHRILVSGCVPYRDKCVLNAVQYVAKKGLEEKVIEFGAVVMKSRGVGGNEEFLYVLAGQDKDSKPYYGRISIKSNTLSTITQQLYQLRTNLSISSTKSQQVKARDLLLYQKSLKSILLEIGNKFHPSFSENELNALSKITLSAENVLALIKMLEESGASVVNKEINGFFRGLHEIRYGGKVDV